MEIVYALPPDQRILDDPYARGFLGPMRGKLVDGEAGLLRGVRRAGRHRARRTGQPLREA